jgi:hypothetical protein
MNSGGNCDDIGISPQYRPPKTCTGANYHNENAGIWFQRGAIELGAELAGRIMGRL